MKKPRTRPLDPAHAEAVRRVIVELGSRRAAEEAGLARESLERAALGVPVMAGTRLLIANWLGLAVARPVARVPKLLP